MSRRALGFRSALVAVLIPAIAILSCSADRTVPKARDDRSSAPASPPDHALTNPGSGKGLAVARALEHLPLYFIENRGQLDSRVAYYVQGRDTTLYFTADGMTLVQTEQKPARSSGRAEDISFRRGVPQTPDPASRWVVKLDFVGANPNPKIEPADRTPAVVSYFSGRQEDRKTGLSTYGSIVYANLWPGIDLVYSGTANRLKYTFLVKPGADPNQVRLAYRGARDVRVNDAGQLEVETPAGVLQDDKPYAYQDVDGRRVEIKAGYSLDRAATDGPHRYGFAVGSYDPSKPLVLDPAVFVYAGYIGGTNTDVGNGIAVDGAGNAYITGYTAVNATMFPATVGPDLTPNGGAFDAFVAKVNAAGTGLVYCGYVGGAGNDIGYGIAVDGSGSAYITGFTDSSETTFPVTVGPDLTYNGGGSAGFGDAFVAKVNAAGTALVYAGYIGGNLGDQGNGIAVDASGNAYVTGMTSSTQATFPVAVGPDLTENGNEDAFVAKVNVSGSALVYCGYIGGNGGGDEGWGIAVDSSGNAYVTGLTGSTETGLPPTFVGFPVTVGPDLTFNGNFDAFVAKVNAAGTALVYCGYIGGSGYDAGSGIAVDSAGSAYVVGVTHSSQATFPVIVGPSSTFAGGSDAFVAKVNTAGTALLYSGYIGGGSGSTQGNAVAVDGSGNAYVTGWTNGTDSFPVTVGPDLTFNGGDDAFVAKVNAAGSALLYCGYIGGIGVDQGWGIAVDGSGNAYVTGLTQGGTFPATVGPSLTVNGGGFDAFVAKIGASASPPQPVLSQVTPSGGRQGQTNLLVSLTGQATHFVQGQTTANFGVGITVINTSVQSATAATAIVTIPGTATPGPRVVTVTTGAEVVALSGFVVAPLTLTNGDFDGDGRSDVAVYRPSNGTWYLLTSSSGFAGGAGYAWGVASDVPVPGDYDGDGRIDVTVYRPSSGQWIILKSSTNFTGASVYQWGTPGDLPEPADYDGDGKTDLAIYRPSTGTWYIVTSSSGFTAGLGYVWGAGADVPVPGDFDGDGRGDLVVYRPSSGHWFILKSSTSFTTSAVYQWGGLLGDVPVPGDYDGDRKTDVAIYRPSSGTWYFLNSSTGFASYTWGASGDVSVSGDYDGDGRIDIVVYRPSSGHWFILKSSTNFTTSVVYQWGTPGDIPILKRP